MMAAAGERDLWVVDEVLATIVPVVLGEGKPLFDRRLPGGPMQLTGTTRFDSGMVELRYEIRR
jgi:dihydrofolate reductase